MLVPRLLEELTSLTERQLWRRHNLDSDNRLERLTRRELEVARLIGDGASNKEIATRLGSASDVRPHRDDLASSASRTGCDSLFSREGRQLGAPQG